MTGPLARGLQPVAGVPFPGPSLAPPIPWRLRQAGVPRLNLKELVMVAVAGEVVPPRDCGAARRSREGRTHPPLPGPGGIVLTQRVGDRCTGLEADGLVPGVSVQSLHRDPNGRLGGANRALNAYACVGDRVLVLDGPARGQRGWVTGKLRGYDQVCVDFPYKVLRRLRIGDRLQIYAYGLGLRLRDHPRLSLHHCSPRLLRRWGVASVPPRLLVPVTHRVPARAMGTSPPSDETLGVSAPAEYRIRALDPAVERRLGLDRLRFGDLIAIQHGPPRDAPGPADGLTVIGLIVSGPRATAGEGPGLISLIAGASRHLKPVLDSRANLATVLGLRELAGNDAAGKPTDLSPRAPGARVRI